MGLTVQNVFTCDRCKLVDTTDANTRLPSGWSMLTEATAPGAGQLLSAPTTYHLCSACGPTVTADLTGDTPPPVNVTP